MKIVTVLGARPQFIKAATLSRAFRMDSSVKETVVHTGQHYDEKMSDIFFREMLIPKPDYSLEVVSKFHGEMTGRMLERVEKIFMSEKPDVILVYGDTNSTLAGALAASKLHIPIAHVEAGLRSFNKRMPEEINRILTDHLSFWLFAPTDSAVANLKEENVDSSRIFKVGDVMYDAILFYQKIAASHSTVIGDLNLIPDNYILATIHRAENTDDPTRLELIFDQLLEISKNKTVVLPLHPRTRSHLKKDYSSGNFRIIDPVGYFDMILLQKHSRLIITDSGGVQKEAFFNKKYCITVREETEWVELVHHNVNFLAKPEALTANVRELWDRPFKTEAPQLYGDGSSAFTIFEILKRKL